MLYNAYVWQQRLTAPGRAASAWTARALETLPAPLAGLAGTRRLRAACQVMASARPTHVRPDWGIDSVVVDGRVTEVDATARDLDAVRQRAALRQARGDGPAAGVARGADLRALRDAAAAHGPHPAGRPRRVRHRLEQRPRHPGRGGPLRARRVHRPRPPGAAPPRARHPRPGRLPAGSPRARGRLRCSRQPTTPRSRGASRSSPAPSTPGSTRTGSTRWPSGGPCPSTSASSRRRCRRSTPGPAVASIRVRPS